MQYKVTLIRLGHVQHLVDFNSIIKWKSQLFTISGIDCIEHLPDSDVEDGFLDVKYTKSRLKTLISCPANSDYAVAVMPYRFEDNFYMHRVNDKCVVISLCGISDILKSDNISIEHFIIKQLYEICAIRHIISDLSSDDVYQFIHPDTRGCLFDLMVNDLIFFTILNNLLFVKSVKENLRANKFKLKQFTYLNMN